MTLDTNIIIAYLGGEKSVIGTLARWKREGRVILLPAIVEAEVLSFPGFTLEERKRTEEFLESFTFVVFDRTVCRLTAEIRRAARIKFPDAAIAASALSTHTPLVTRNIADFKKIHGLDLLSL